MIGPPPSHRGEDAISGPIMVKIPRLFFSSSIKAISQQELGLLRGQPSGQMQQPSSRFSSLQRPGTPLSKSNSTPGNSSRHSTPINLYLSQEPQPQHHAEKLDGPEQKGVDPMKLTNCLQPGTGPPITAKPTPQPAHTSNNHHPKPENKYDIRLQRRASKKQEEQIKRQNVPIS